MRQTTLLVALVGFTAAQSVAQTVTLTPSKDNTLYEAFSDPQSNGAGEYLFAGYTIRGAGERRALLRFDIASALPPGAQVVSATLRLNISRNNADINIGLLHRSLADWGEGASNAGGPGGQGTSPAPGDATWLHRFFPNVFWASTGGDFVTTPSGQASLPGAPTLGPVFWATSSGIVSDVQAWLDQPATNFGWVLRLNDGGIGALRFDSREATAASVRPTLTIVYTPGCPCVADFDGSGGTPDAGDIDVYFASWLAGDASADADCSGGTPDAGDIDAFFAQWLAGGC